MSCEKTLHKSLIIEKLQKIFFSLHQVFYASKKLYMKFYMYAYICNESHYIISFTEYSSWQSLRWVREG